MALLQQSALLLIEFQQEWLSENGKLYHLFEDHQQVKDSQKNAEKVLIATRSTPLHILHSGLSYSPTYKELGSAHQGLRATIPSHQTFQTTSVGSQFAKPFIPQPNEFIVTGRLGSSAFSGSNLDHYLRYNHIQTLYLMGYALHVCVESTLRAAHDLGYEVILIEDATSAFTTEQKKYVLDNIVHHFGKSITTTDYLTYIEQQKGKVNYA